MAKKIKEAPPPRRQRRDVDQRIAELAGKIAALKAREAQRQAKADPAKKHASAALRSIDKALAAAGDPATKRVLSGARSSLGAWLGGENGVLLPAGARRAASVGEDLAGVLLDHVRSHPGQRGEQIAVALGTDASSMRPAMKRLIADGKISTEGQRRGMTYAAV